MWAKGLLRFKLLIVSGCGFQPIFKTLVNLNHHPKRGLNNMFETSKQKIYFDRQIQSIYWTAPSWKSLGFLGNKSLVDYTPFWDILGKLHEFTWIVRPSKGRIHLPKHHLWWGRWCRPDTSYQTSSKSSLTITFTIIYHHQPQLITITILKTIAPCFNHI